MKWRRHEPKNISRKDAKTQRKMLGIISLLGVLASLRETLLILEEPKQ
jgi:hypothetical protein